MKKINLKVIALAAASMLAIAACGNGGQKPAQRLLSTTPMRRGRSRKKRWKRTMRKSRKQHG